MSEEMKMQSQIMEGRNAVIEAFRSGKPVDKLFVLDGCQDGPVRTIVREARKHIAWYLKGVPGNAQIKEAINRENSLEKVKEILNKI